MRRALPIFLLVALAAGCDYFRPAEPEPPSSAIPFVPDYSNPDSTLATMARAITDKGRTIGGVAYAAALAESVTAGSPAGFHQTFWPDDAFAYAEAGGQVPGDWGFDLERSFYTKFIRLRPDSYHMVWSLDPPNPDNVGADLAIIHRHYLVTTHDASGAQTGVLAIGFADLRVVRFSDGNWRIVRWDDRRDPDADLDDPEQMTLGRRRLNSQ